MTAALVLRRDMDQLGIEERELTTAWVYKVEDDAIGSLFILLEEPNSSKLGAHLCLRNSQALDTNGAGRRKHRVAGACSAPFSAADGTAATVGALTAAAVCVSVCSADHLDVPDAAHRRLHDHIRPRVRRRLQVRALTPTEPLEPLHTRHSLGACSHHTHPPSHQLLLRPC